MRFLTVILIFILLPATVFVEDTPPSTDSLRNPPSVTANNEVSESSLPGDNHDQFQSYSQLVNIWRFINLFVTILILLLIVRTGLSVKLVALSQKIPNRFFALWGYLTLFLVVYFLAKLPFTIYRYFLVESEYGFVNLSFSSWLMERFVSLGVMIAVGIVPVWLAYNFMKTSKRWWLYMTGALAPIIIIGIVATPLVISPLFNEFKPLPESALHERINNLTEKAGLENPDIFTVNASKQSTKINAYVTGLLGSERIVLYDTMLDAFTEAEILYVTAHELGHYVQKHIWIGVLIAIVLVLFGLWLLDKLSRPLLDRYKQYLQNLHLDDYAALPFLLAMMLVINFMFQPLINSISRYQEHRADIYALELSDVSLDDAVSTYEKLSMYNLSDPNPHPVIEFWFYSHPSLNSRIEFVAYFHETNNKTGRNHD